MSEDTEHEAILKDMLDGMEETLSVKRSWYFFCPIKAVPRQAVQKGPHSFFTPKKSKEFMKSLLNKVWAQYGMRNPPLTTPVRLIIIMAWPWTKKALVGNRYGWKFKDTRPDTDNTQKNLYDSLNGVIYKDDAQIVDVTVRKIWFEQAYIAIRLDEVSERF